jgi:N-methylhydantoinase A
MRIGVDIGGTFADLAAYDEMTGKLHVAKALNSPESVVAAVREAFDTAGLTFVDIDEFVHGTTMVTNLLIERTGARVGLVASRGFRDVLELGRGYRPGTFDVAYNKARPIIPRGMRREVGGRITAWGVETEPPSEGEISEVVRGLVEAGAEVIAVALYNAYANPAHERLVKQVCERDFPDLPVTLSTEIDNRIGEFERASTVSLNASAVPKMRAYAAQMEDAIGRGLSYMHSAGGMISSSEARERPISLALSGPAAGVLAARQLGEWAGFTNIIALDVGGTSTDVCLVWESEFHEEKEFELEWGVPARTRALAIHTIGAGGGSIASVDAGGSLQVGPRSAAASPGPACYGRGGTSPTVTDANLVLGILPAEEGLLGGGLSLDKDAAERSLTGLAERFRTDVAGVAAGVFSVVNANMAQAIRRITVEKGIDPRDAIIVAYGGAGPQHAAHVAKELGISTVAVPAHAGAFSAFGLLLAQRETSTYASIVMPLAEAVSSPRVESIFKALTQEAHERLSVGPETSVEDRQFVGLRYDGQSHEVPVEWTPAAPETMVSRFEDEHRRLYGTSLGRPIEAVDVWVTATVPTSRPIGREDLDSSYAGETAGARRSSRYLALAGREVPVYGRGALEETREGPCLVEETNSVTYVPEGFHVSDRHSYLILESADDRTEQ